MTTATPRWTARHPTLTALLLVGIFALVLFGGLWGALQYFAPASPADPIPPPPPERQLLRIKAHPHEVLRLAFSPDGARIASTGWDGEVVVWDAATGKVVHTLSGPKRHVVGLAFSPDGGRLAAGSMDHSLTVWDTATGEETLRLHDHSDGVTCVAYSADGQHLVSGGLDRKVLLCEAGTGRGVKSFQAGPSPPLAVALSPDGKQVLALGTHGTAQVFDVASGKTLRLLLGVKQELEAAAFSRDGRRLAFAAKAWDRKGVEHFSQLELREVESGEATVFFSKPRGPMTGLAVSSDGARLAMGGYGQSALIWEIPTGRELLILPHEAVVTAVAWSPDGKRLATGTKVAGQMGELRIWNVEVER